MITEKSDSSEVLLKKMLDGYGALPVYFGGEVVMEMEPTVVAIAGDLNSYFYLDTRGLELINYGRLVTRIPDFRVHRD